MFHKALLGLAILPCLFAVASAEQHKTVVHGKEFIVHTNPVPVVVHRVLPPYWNKHISARELKSGRIPASTRK
ncbi:MAG: hypothetical protein NTW52_01410 [Planctomycetota bacterium]|nr:hypothetical protein [Planctomycetota bacterium]